MSALRPEQRERLESLHPSADGSYNLTGDTFRALLADSAALAQAERERDEANGAYRGVRAALDRSIAQVATLLPWARFGAWAFEEFWHDAEPGDIEAGDAQEKASALGLLARTSEVDAGATHAEGCEWQPGMAAEECCCFSPCKPPLTATAPESEVQP